MADSKSLLLLYEKDSIAYSANISLTDFKVTNNVPLPEPKKSLFL